MRNRTTTTKKIVEHLYGSDAAREYKHQPTSPRVLIVEPKELNIKCDKDGVHLPDGRTIPYSGVSTSLAAVGQGAVNNTVTNPSNLFPIPGPEPLAQADETEVFAELTRENKFWVLQALGFKPTGPGRWWHNALSEVETFDNIEFDIDNDDLPKLVTILVLQGIRRGNHHIRQTIKSALGI